jgi:hypothetical protein
MPRFVFLVHLEKNSTQRLVSRYQEAFGGRAIAPIRGVRYTIP